MDVFLVIARAVEMVDRGADGRAKIVAIQGGRRFAGEPNPFDDRAIPVDGRIAGDGAPGSPVSTSAPGIVAVGDMRSGSVKRAAPDMGVGPVRVRTVHAFLADPVRAGRRRGRA